MKPRCLLICLCYLGQVLIYSGCKKEQAIQVTPGFSYAIADSSYTVPVKVNFTNTSSGATKYQWTFEGGEPASSTQKDPGTITFNTAGAHTVKLEAWNEDVKQAKTITLQLDSTVNIDFTPTVQVNNFLPVTVTIENHTIGASTYAWAFEGGQPASSAQKDPDSITFNTAGEHSITLIVSNGRQNFTLVKKITVLPALAPSFDIIPSFEDDDYQAPFIATVKNTSVSGLTWKWAVPGGKADNDTAANPTITFTNPGTYTITLTANNNKEQKTASKTITILPNTNLRTFSDIKFGVNTAHETIGSFFSTKLRKTFTANDDLSIAGKDIDLVFFGLNSNFTYNKFISPDSAQFYTYDKIFQAQRTSVINSQELCNNISSISASDFVQMQNDNLLRLLSFSNAADCYRQFNNSTVPRIVLFQSQDGRKGAVYIKQFIAAGTSSYVLTDIKVQKEAK